MAGEVQEESAEEEEEEPAEVVEQLSEEIKQADGGARDVRGGGLGRSILGDKPHRVRYAPYMWVSDYTASGSGLGVETRPGYFIQNRLLIDIVVIRARG